MSTGIPENTSENDHLLLFLEPLPTGRWLGRYPADPEPVFLNDRQYHGVDIENIFFSFIVTDQGCVAGVELTPLIETGRESALRDVFTREDRPSYIEIRDGFPTVWLSPLHAGQGRGLEAFTVDYLEADDGHWALLLSVGCWLTPLEIDSMRRLPIQWL